MSVIVFQLKCKHTLLLIYKCHLCFFSPFFYYMHFQNLINSFSIFSSANVFLFVLERNIQQPITAEDWKNWLVILGTGYSFCFPFLQNHLINEEVWVDCEWSSFFLLIIFQMQERSRTTEDIDFTWKKKNGEGKGRTVTSWANCCKEEKDLD